MKLIPILAVLLAIASATQAQNTAPVDSVPLAPLPAPAVADEAAPSEFITAARSAIAAGRSDEAMEAIERAESRVLIRSVRPSRAGVPSDQALVRLLAEARGALGQGDRAGALAMLAEVLASPALDAGTE